MFDHPQVLAEGLVTTLENPSVGRYRGFAKPIHFAETPCSEPYAAPGLGQHTADLLARYGYSDEEVQHLRDCGAIPG
jgi:crotonobetainyl-CoA:carnitine CoA-transferase CaiB-like acyl-CoA transferase